MLNVHPSLLPHWRGAAPIERAIMAGEERTGVCVMEVAAGLDSGRVALCEELPIGPEEDFEALAANLAALGGELLVRAFDLLAGGKLELTEQDDDAATYAEKIAPEERRLDPKRPAVELARTVRALTPHVGAYLETSGGERQECGGHGRSTSASKRVRCGPSGGRSCSAAARGRCGSRLCSRPGASRWRPTPTCAVTSCRSCESANPMIAPARLLAYETIGGSSRRPAGGRRRSSGSLTHSFGNW